jgi:lipoyl(octanoyl) transferase
LSSVKLKTTIIKDTVLRAFWLGQVEYTACWELQRELASARLEGVIDDILLLLEHPPTITLGRSFKATHLLATEDRLLTAGIALVDVDRGGDVTYHGPGQLVGYPIFDLKDHGQDLHLFLRNIEKVLIRSISRFGLSGRRFAPHTGVWVGDEKIAAIGIKVSKWISTHGFALNVDPEMSHFGHIVPCGIHEFGVTSMQALKGGGTSVLEMRDVVEEEFRTTFVSSHDICEHLGGQITEISGLSPKSHSILESAVEMIQVGYV